jgi:hypothetical protein
MSSLPHFWQVRASLFMSPGISVIVLHFLHLNEGLYPAFSSAASQAPRMKMPL